MSTVDDRVAAFGLASRWADLSGPVHYLEGGDPGSGTTIVLLHGLGGSHTNWLAIAPGLARRARVLVPDLLGFGRTPPAGRDPGVRGHQRLVDRFLREVAGGPAVLVGNSMGGLVAMLETTAAPDLVTGLALVDPSLPRVRRDPIDREVAIAFAAYTIPGAGTRLLQRRRARLGPEGSVRATLALCCCDPSRVPADVVVAHVEAARERARRPWADAAFLRSARSILATHAGGRSWGLVQSLPRVPTLLLHGTGDRLVPITSAREAARRRPEWTTHILDDIGHVPMLEAPGRTLALLEGWLPQSRPASEVHP